MVSCAKTAEPIEMVLGLRTWVRWGFTGAEGRCHGNQFWDAICHNWLWPFMGYNFGCSDTLFDSRVVRHSPTAAALWNSFLLNHVPNSPELNTLIRPTGFRESLGVNMSCESKIEEIMQRLIEIWQCTITLMQFSCYVLPGSEETQVI